MKYDDIYSFKMCGHNMLSSFHLTVPISDLTAPIGRIPAGVKVIVTEIKENDGTTVINGASQIGAEICRWFNINPAQLVHIEFYPERSLKYEDVSEVISSFNTKYIPTLGEWSLVHHRPLFASCDWMCLSLSEIGYIRDFATAYCQ